MDGPSFISRTESRLECQSITPRTRLVALLRAVAPVDAEAWLVAIGEAVVEAAHAAAELAPTPALRDLLSSDDFAEKLRRDEVAACEDMSVVDEELLRDALNVPEVATGFELPSQLLADGMSAWARDNAAAADRVLIACGVSPMKLDQLRKRDGGGAVVGDLFAGVVFPLRQSDGVPRMPAWLEESIASPQPLIAASPTATDGGATASADRAAPELLVTEPTIVRRPKPAASQPAVTPAAAVEAGSDEAQRKPRRRGSRPPLTPQPKRPQPAAKPPRRRLTHSTSAASSDSEDDDDDVPTSDGPSALSQQRSGSAVPTATPARSASVEVIDVDSPFAGCVADDRGSLLVGADDIPRLMQTRPDVLPQEVIAAYRRPMAKGITGFELEKHYGLKELRDFVAAHVQDGLPPNARRRVARMPKRELAPLVLKHFADAVEGAPGAADAAELAGDAAVAGAAEGE